MELVGGCRQGHIIQRTALIAFAQRDSRVRACTVSEGGLGSHEPSRGGRPSVADLERGEHVFWPYASTASRRRVLCEYLSAGLSAGERLLFVAVDPHERLRSDLADAPFDVDHLVRRGEMLVASIADAYLPDGRFDPDRRLREYAELVEAAVRDGFAGLRVAADATPLLTDARVRDAWPAYELRADLLARRMPFVALCAYDSRSDRDALELMAAVHGRCVEGCSSLAAFGLHAGEGGGIAVEGEVDTTCAETVRDLVRQVVRDLEEVTLDLSGLSFADVAGVRAIAGGAQDMAERRGPVLVAGAPPSFRRVWSALGYDTDSRARLAEDEVAT